MTIRPRRFPKRVRLVFCINLSSPHSTAQFGLDLFDEPFASDRDGVGPAIVPRGRTVSKSRLHPLAMLRLKFLGVVETTERTESAQIDEAIPLTRILDLAVPAVVPFRRMTHRAGPHHVQIDVHKTAMQV